MNATETATLYRPVSPEELELIRQREFRAFPPRPPEQPIFYSVLTEAHAIRIASGWNAKTSRAVYVTRFQVRKAFLDRYEVQNAGGPEGQGYWIPAEDLTALHAKHRGTDRGCGEVSLTWAATRSEFRVFPAPFRRRTAC